jgi:hypothetical protein
MPCYCECDAIDQHFAPARAAEELATYAPLFRLSCVSARPRPVPGDRVQFWPTSVTKEVTGTHEWRRLYVMTGGLPRS